MTGRPPVGVVGAGPMGLALITHLVADGWTVHCHDISAPAVEAAVAAGAATAADPRELAARCGVVITFLPGPAQVRDVALDLEHGVLAGLPPGGIMLDMSTCGPDTADLLGDAFDRAGRRFADCPVSRKAPDMTVLVGGAPGVLGDAEPVLRAVSRSIVHCGRRGAGYAVKLLNQHVKYAWYLASAEALVVAREFGVDPALTATAVELCSGGDSGLTAAAKWFRGDAEGIRKHAPATTIAKDAALAAAMARAAGVRSPTLDVTAEFFGHVVETPYRDLPYPASCALLADRITGRDGPAAPDTDR